MNNSTCGVVFKRYSLASFGHPYACAHFIFSVCPLYFPSLCSPRQTNSHCVFVEEAAPSRVHSCNRTQGVTAQQVACVRSPQPIPTLQERKKKRCVCVCVCVCVCLHYYAHGMQSFIYIHSANATTCSLHPPLSPSHSSHPFPTPPFSHPSPHPSVPTSVYPTSAQSSTKSLSESSLHIHSVEWSRPLTPRERGTQSPSGTAQYHGLAGDKRLGQNTRRGPRQKAKTAPPVKVLPMKILDSPQHTQVITT